MEHTSRDEFVDKIMEVVDHGFDYAELRALEKLVEVELNKCKTPPPRPRSS